jgi:hypothetical protein
LLGVFLRYNMPPCYLSLRMTDNKVSQVLLNPTYFFAYEIGKITPLRKKCLWVYRRPKVELPASA